MVVVTICLVVLMALLSGVAIATDMYVVVVPIAAAVPAIYMLMRPAFCLVSFAGLTLILAGTLKFFLGLGQFQWVLSALGAALLVYSLVSSKFSPIRTAPLSASGIDQAIILWWVVLVFSSVSNAVPFFDWLVGLRTYLPVLGVFAYLAYCRPKNILLRQIFIFMLLIASVQWVFCIYQKFWIVPSRIAGGYPGSPWDSIVGSFGGEKYGGGESGSLGVYLSIVIVVAAALKKESELSFFAFFSVVATSFLAMAMIESKVVALMVPVGCYLVYRSYVYKKPARFFLGTMVVAALMAALLISYYFMYWQAETRLGLWDSVVSRLSYSFDPHFQASSVNLGRVKSLVFWWDKHSFLSDPLKLIVGHGLASAVSSSSIIGQGTAVAEFRTMLDVTGASKLLWESGLLGLFVFLAVFAFGFARANRLKSHPLLPPWHRAAMSGVEASMVLMPLSVFYEVTVVSSPPMQFVAMFLLGYVAYWWREVSGARRVG